MKNRSIAYVSHSALRDHATNDRVDRIWDRIDAELPLIEVPTSVSHRWIPVLAAAVSALAVGLLVGKTIWDQPDQLTAARVPALAAADVTVPQEVFAAAVRERSYPLPGGGRISLSQGTLFELVGVRNEEIELRFIQGEATVETQDTETSSAESWDSKSARRVVVLAGDASVSARGRVSIFVKRDGESMLVRVNEGFAVVQSFDGERGLAEGEETSVMLLRSTRIADTLVPVHSPTRIRPTVPANAAAELESPRAPIADTLARGKTDDSESALKALAAQYGGLDGAIAAAADADSLWQIHDLAIRRNPSVAYRALARVVEAFPGDPYASLAAFKLGSYYRRTGRDDMANHWFAQAAASPDGVLAEDVLCEQFKSATSEVEGRRLAQEYWTKYPNGRCREEAQRLIVGQESGGDDDTLNEPTENENKGDYSAE